MSKIKKVSYFACGSCKNQASLLFKGQARKTLYFPAGVFLLEHREAGYILYDTGYSFEVMRFNLRNLAYRLPNPVSMTEDDTIDAQLQSEGIPTDAIKNILISHLHPDHIGRLRAFDQATFYMTLDCYKTYCQSKPRDLVFRHYFPDDFEERLVILEMDHISTVLPHQFCYDFLGDGSLILHSLDGHARGQMGVYIAEKQLFLAADVLWGMAFLNKVQDMRFLPRLIQQDFKAYLASAALVSQLIDKGIHVLFSHDPEERIRKLIND